MRNFLAASILFLFLFAIIACDKDALPNEAYVLAFEETVDLANSDLSVQFVKVLEDARCPGEGEVLCIREDEVKILLKIIESRSFVEMELTQRGSMPELAQGEYGEYTIELIKVTPEVVPTDRVLEQKDYSIELKIN